MKGRASAQEAVLTGVLSGGMALVVLSFCAGILLDIVDALFVCYATDRCLLPLSDRPPSRDVSFHRREYQLFPILHSRECLLILLCCWTGAHWRGDTYVPAAFPNRGLPGDSKPWEMSTPARLCTAAGSEVVAAASGRRDRSRVTKADVHEVYSQLPVGAVVGAARRHPPLRRPCRLPEYACLPLICTSFPADDTRMISTVSANGIRTVADTLLP